MRMLSISMLAITTLALAGCDKAVTSPQAAQVSETASITYGSHDGNAHPAVVLIIMDIGGSPAYRCSGTLISARFVVTAGHCTGEPGEFSGMRVFTESDVENGNNNFPYAGPNTVEARSWRAHPQYTNAAFYLHDVGVIELASSVRIASYGKLPSLDQLDAMKPRSSATFTAVGYGLQKVNPVHVQADLIRMNANPHLIQINTGFTGSGSLLLSNNASTGGTCFGDSGGPNYLGSSSTIAGVTSFGLNGSCGGTGGVFRLDRKDVLDFVTSVAGR